MKGIVHRSHHLMIESSGLMILGAIVALTWANQNFETYHDLVEFDLGTMWGIHFTPHFIVNEILMVFFFAIAGKEIREAFLPGGDLYQKEARPLPFIATAGGMVGPALCFIAMALVIERDLIPRGIAIPTATDIAFARLGGKLIYGTTKHPAVTFLTVLAIADDAGGLIVLATFYQSWDFVGLAIGGVLLAIATAISLSLRFHFRVTHYAPYGAAGIVAWIAFHVAGIHPALALVPLVFMMPHALRDEGLFGEEHRSGGKRDTLNTFEHHFEVPIEVLLFAFAFVNAGVQLGGIGAGTYAVLVSLVVGKPVGIFIFAWVAMKIKGYTLPPGMQMLDLLTIGMLAGIGFTVSLFVAGVAYESGVYLDQTRLGALFSFSSVGVALSWSYLAKRGRFGTPASAVVQEDRRPTHIREHT